MYSIPEKLYLIRGELKWNVVGTTPSTWHGEPVIRVSYRSSSGVKSWNYSPVDVEELPYLRSETGQFRFRDQRGLFSIACRIHRYGRGNAVCAESKTGFLSFGFADELCIETSLLDSPFRSVFDYLHSLSGISRIDDGSGNIVSLKERYESVRHVFSSSILYRYCHPEGSPVKRSSGRDSQPLIFPFGCNESQFHAVSNAFSGNSVSVIQGPPGTGKTQTILNIIANLLIREKTCLVVSNNNSAVSNVVEKLSRPEYGMGWLIASLGSKENRERFLSGQNGLYPDLSSWVTPGGTSVELLKGRLQKNASRIPAYFDAVERLAVLREERAEVLHQMELKGDPCEKVPFRLRLLGVKAKRLYGLLVRIDSETTHRGGPGIISKIRCAFYGFGKDTIDREAIASAARQLSLKEKDREAARLDTATRKMKPFLDSLTEESLSYLRSVLWKRYSGKKDRQVFRNEDLMFRNAQAFIDEYPIVTSTTFSSTSCIDAAVPFDCLIMDEASQVDIASGALALNTALSAVIVGDPKQLPNVVTSENAAYADGLFRRSGLGEAYRFTGNSFLDSVMKVFPSAPVVLLREHYRCAPQIIGFCNQQFYGGRLVIMTRRSDDGCPTISAIRTVKGNHARGASNEREAEEVVGSIRSLAGQFDDIGVIAPYNEQVNLIRTRLREAGISGIEVATVHKFQGREKDCIILSTTSNGATPFVDDQHMLNVAVSRAKKCFVLVTTGNDITDGNIKSLIEYIGYCGGTVSEGRIRSVFDMLYGQYSEERKAWLSSHATISQYDTENFVFSILSDIVGSPGFDHLGILFQYPLSALVPEGTPLSEEETLFASRSWTLVDFLVYDKVTRRPVLVIEADGMSFHAEGSEQWKRDRLKDSILEKSGVRCLRLPTNGSRERERIVEALEKRE